MSFKPLLLPVVAALIISSTLFSCKKDTGDISKESDTVYLLTAIHKNNVLLDSMVYDTAKLRLQRIITPSDTPGLSFKLDFTYDSDYPIVSSVAHKDTRDLAGTIDYIAHNNNTLQVISHYTWSNTLGDTINYQLNTDGQPTLAGSKDTVTKDYGRLLEYRETTLSTKNTTQSYAAQFQDLGYLIMADTKSVSLTYDTHPNPFFLLYRNYPPLSNYWLNKLDFAFDAINNPVTATSTENEHFSETVYPTLENSNTISYVYDSVTQYPVQQTYTINEYDNTGEIVSKTYTITFSYQQVIVKR